jgi:SAM-dependent methyltransferase
MSEKLSAARGPAGRASGTTSRGKALRLSLKGVRLRAARAFLRSAFKAARGRNSPYEPVEIAGRTYASKRESGDRWNAIASVLRAYDAASVLDIGCAEGWFLRKATSELGCFALGVEASERLLLGEIARLHDDVPRMSIMKAMLGADDIRKLPVCDAVLCLSVVHHVVRKNGLDGAREFLRAIGERTGKVLIFEMGTSEEPGLRWANLLPEMHAGQEAFLRELLGSAGFVNINRVASSSAFRPGAERVMLSAEPSRRGS